MLELTLIQKICVWIIPILSSITLHEAAHAYAANHFGDSTAKALGRLSINPFRHVDIVGSIIVPLFIGIMSDFQFIFGWAKPVPVNWGRLRNPNRDGAIVAFAGPGANLCMALMWALCFKIGLLMDPKTSWVLVFLLLTASAGITINVLLAILNLIPLPPLDGSRIVSSFLSPQNAIQYAKIEPYGFLILIALLVTGILSAILNPVMNFTILMIRTLFNL
jgi:Zn-dependent protease